MSKKITLLVIPDDDSETKFFSFNKIFFKFLFFIIVITFITFILTALIFAPKILKYEDLNEKYSVLVEERLKVFELMKNLEKLNQMDEFVRNSLDTEFNFLKKPEIADSILMTIPNNNLISLSDNIPSLAPIEGFVSKRMESTFSSGHEIHGGIDIVAKEGTPIKSAASGVVVFSGWNYELGNLIIIYHGDDYMTHYGHNQRNLVARLDVVKRGEVIGLVGNTGISSGPHLHFEVWKDEKSIDPLIYFPEYLKNDLTLKK